MRHFTLLLILMISITSSITFGHSNECVNCTKKRLPGPPDALKGRIDPTDKRYATMAYVLKLLKEREAKTLVETGTAREGTRLCHGDGCSTLIWGHWAKQNDAILYSVDINPDSIQKSWEASFNYHDNIEFVCSDSISFLANFSMPIDYLYLDSFDYDPSNPCPSQEHHLKEIIAAYPWLTKQSIVMVDDCDLPGGGKCRLVVDYLLEKGWKILMQRYQVILSQE